MPAVDASLSIRQGESFPVFASVTASSGTLTVQGTPTVSLFDAAGAIAGSIENEPVTGATSGAASTVQAWYLLLPALTEALSPGAYRLVFTLELLGSDSIARTYTPEIALTVEPVPGLSLSPSGWARLALTGDADASAPTDATLAPLLASVRRRLLASWRCLGTNPDATLTGDDADAWAEWLGYTVAARFAGTPAGRALIAPASKTVVKIGPVTKETSNGSGGASFTTADLLRSAQSARGRIACIRARFAASDTSAVMTPDLTGRRRTLGDAGTVEGDLLGSGDGVVRRSVP